MIGDKFLSTNYEEAVELIDKVKPSKETANVEVTNTAIVLAIISAMNPISRKLLSELTGINLSSNHNLYDYIVKSVDFGSKEKTLEWSIYLTTAAMNSEQLRDFVEDLLKSADKGEEVAD